MGPLPEYCCAVLSDPRGRLLLQLRSGRARHAPNQLTCFGGRRESGEGADACLMRELQEELGWAPSPAHADICCELWKSARLVARFYRVAPSVDIDRLTIEADSLIIAAPWPSLPGLPVSPWHRVVLDGLSRGLTRVSVPLCG
jgi:8-oxo-dGTP pyrophosphatase MutT (NUDIX family)